MNFGEKLNFLMNITNTSNSQLAKAVLIDASYISRLRSGIRNLPKNKKYIELLSDFFANNINQDYQINSVCDKLSIEYFNFENKEELKTIINNWFTQRNLKEKSFDNFILNLSQFNFQKNSNGIDLDLLKKQHLQNVSILKVATFYGIKGRQNSTLLFLSYVLKSKQPQVLYLLSEDGLDWLTSNKEYFQTVCNLLYQLINQGHKIKIIHTIKRNFYEMLYMIDAWLPLYISGAIEPYYYPKAKDSLIMRTLFLAPDTAAVVSTTVSDNLENNSSLLFTDKKMITEFLNL
jgi:transcriptional regulator with XRE-family HTH domain